MEGGGNEEVERGGRKGARQGEWEGVDKWED